MIRTLLRRARVYGGVAAVVPKLYMAYSLWFWVEFLGQILMMTIFVYFWRAVYAGSQTLGGLTEATTINYILLAQIIAPLVRWSLIQQFGSLVREGMIAIEMLRPVDFQGRFYIQGLAGLLTMMVRQALPLGLVAWLGFGLQLPADPAVWGAAILALLLGHAVLFFFDWTFACLAFYTTEVWGLHIFRQGVSAFFSGSLVPLVMMPEWLQAVAAAMPFGQALYVPVSILNGMVPLEQVPRLWLVQGLWLVGLWALSRLTFNVAVRKVTVQGG